MRREHTRVFVWATLEDTLREGDAGGGGGGGGGGEGHGERECVGIVWRLPRVREGVEGSKSEGEEVTVGRGRENSYLKLRQSALLEVHISNVLLYA